MIDGTVAMNCIYLFDIMAHMHRMTGPDYRYWHRYCPDILTWADEPMN